MDYPLSTLCNSFCLRTCNYRPHLEAVSSICNMMTRHGVVTYYGIFSLLFFKNNLLPCKAMGWTVGVLGFDSRRGLGIFLFTTASRTALGPTQPPIQWVRGALSLGVNRPGREADRSPPSSPEVKECVELYLHSPNTSSWRGA
jgi:hypothetical protein